MVVQLGPQRVVGRLGVEHDGLRVGQRRLLAIVELIGVAEVEQLGVAVLSESLLSGPDRTLDPSVFAVDGFGDEYPAQLLEAILEDAVLEGRVPGLREGAQDLGVVGAHCLAFRPRSPVQARVLEIGLQLGIADGGGIDVRNARGHASMLLRGWRRTRSTPMAPVRAIPGQAAGESSSSGLTVAGRS